MNKKDSFDHNKGLFLITINNKTINNKSCLKGTLFWFVLIIKGPFLGLLWSWRVICCDQKGPLCSWKDPSIARSLRVDQYVIIFIFLVQLKLKVDSGLMPAYAVETEAVKLQSISDSDMLCPSFKYALLRPSHQCVLSLFKFNCLVPKKNLHRLWSKI